MTEKIKLL